MFLREEIDELYNRFSDKVYEENALSEKTKELIAIACSVMADCVPCLSWHYQKAVEARLSKEEISEALAIAMSVCSGSKRAKYSELIDELEKKR
ncbi:MAG: carboxymuconolactone decarboxylase family protein [Bacteroidales bacterium]|jgi:AhpD family alkylhydroperoxidase